MIDTVKKDGARPTVSAVLPDGSLVELVYRVDERRTCFCVCTTGEYRFEESLLVDGRRLVPYSPSNNLLTHEVVLFPSHPADYDSDADLVRAIQAFIHRYVDVSPLFEQLASYYVLLSWVYDRFNELAYLRVRGDYGSGKTRFLQVVGSLCYKPIFASGASTVSPIFRILDAVRGTLVIDEGDFRLSDERAEVVKILNNGNARGFPVLRSELTGKHEYNPTAYAVFGPKLVATRGFFQDRALESRCLTEEMGQGRLRGDIPITLPETFKTEALQLRNQLLLFRFRNYLKGSAADDLVDAQVEPRLNQILLPLLSLIEEPQARQDLRDLGRRMHRQVIADRGLEMEAQLLEIIRDLRASTPDTRLTLKEITQWFADRYGEEYDRKVTTKWVGSILRKKLQLRPQKSHGVFVIPPSEVPKFDQLFEKYGLGPDDGDETAGEPDASHDTTFG